MFALCWNRMTPHALIRLTLTLPVLLTASILTVSTTGCGHSAPKVVIGSQNTTEQAIVGEIVAQHLENRLGIRVTRRPAIGGPLPAYQELQSGDVSIYPEYTGTIVTEILKEQPAPNPDQNFARAKGELARIAQADLENPLGIDSAYAAVIRAEDPHSAKVSSLTEAAQSPDGWRLGYSYEFQQRTDGMPALTQYHLPMSVPMRAMDEPELFKAMGEGELTIIVAHETDGELRSHNWKTLADDRKLFTPQPLCLIVRQDLEKAEPRVAGALAELAGKLSNEKMRQLNAQVDTDHQTVADTAKGFLAGLK